MDSKQLIRQQKTELKESVKERQQERKEFMPAAPEELLQKEQTGDDLVFECNDQELQKRLNNAAEELEPNIALEMQRSKHAGNFMEPEMMKRTREKSAPDPNAPVPDNTLLQEEKKAEIAVNVMDMKNAEKHLDLSKLAKGEQQEKKKTEVKKKEKKAPEDHSLPAALKATMQSIVNDKRSSSGYYSGIKTAAKKLLALDLNKKADAAKVSSAMAELMNAAILYRDKRSGNRLLSKGKQRAQWVDALIGGMRDFTLDQNPVYMLQITREWQKKLTRGKGYPSHLKKWMKKEAGKLPLKNKGKDIAVSEHSFVLAVVMKNKLMRKKLADEAGWTKVAIDSMTTDQATRISPLVSGYVFHDIHTDGTGVDEEGEKQLSSLKSNMKLLKSKVPAERAKVLNPILQKFLDMRLTPEMLSPQYYLSHMNELSFLGEALTLYQNVFSSKNDKTNAAYIKSLPAHVQKKLYVVYHVLNAVQSNYSLMNSHYIGVSEHGLREQNDRTQQAADAYKPLAPLVKRFSDTLNGAPGKLELVEYKAGMEIKKGVVYYSMQKVKGMPKDCIIATEAIAQNTLNVLKIMSENTDAYKDFLDNPVDLEKELKTAGPAVNDELLKNVDIPEDSPAILLADKQTEFWKNSLKDIEAEVKKLELQKQKENPQEQQNQQKQKENPQEQQGQQNQQETQKKEDQILFHIQIVKEISVRNEKIKKVLDTNKELTQEQINSLNAELTANQELLNYENKEKIKEAMEIRVQKVIMMKYVELYGEAELKKARELGNAAKKDFLAKRQEAGL